MDKQKNKSKKTAFWAYAIVPILIFLLILIFSGLAIFFLLNKFFGENCWICENGQWIKNEHPSAETAKDGRYDKMAEKIKCELYNVEECPLQCVICPPCPECSSISCQSQEFCEKMGIDRDWYEKIKNATDKNNLIRLTSPLPEQKISSPLKIEGSARGTWFFEGSFPVILTNWDGLIIAQGIAKAQSDPADEGSAGWMTEDFVKFNTELTFEKHAYGEKGSLILKKDNPSGLPKYDDALEIPVVFE